MTDRKEYSFFIDKNGFATEAEKNKFPKDDYPIYISLVCKDSDLIQMKDTLSKVPKSRLKYQQKGGYAQGLDIFASDVDSVKHVLFHEESPLKDAALIVRKAVDEQILPYQILDKARQIVEEPNIDIQKPQTGRKR